MPDYGADGTLRPESVEPGLPDRPVEGEHEVTDPLVHCPSCGADVIPREASHGATEPSRGLACPSCGEIILST